MTLTIISRQEWGARHGAGFGPAPLPAREVWLHHSVTVAPDLLPPFDDEHAAMRVLEDIGQRKFGGGVSYTFAIMPTGRIYEGHGVGRQGAHTKDRNSFARGIVLVGNYDVAEPTAAQLTAAAALLLHGERVGWWTTATLAGGHRQAPGASTVCPGRHAMAAIDDIHDRAADLATGEHLTPAPTHPGDPDMRAIREPNGTIWLASPLGGVRWTRNLKLANAVAKVHNPAGSYIDCTREEINELIALADAERAALRRDLAAGDVDEAELARQLAPMIVGHMDKLTAEDLGALAGAVASEAGRRLTATPASPAPVVHSLVSVPDDLDESTPPADDTAAPGSPADRDRYVDGVLAEAGLGAPFRPLT